MSKQIPLLTICDYIGLVKLAIRMRQSLIILNYRRTARGDMRRHMLYLRRN